MIKEWTSRSVSEFHKALRKVVEDFAATQGVTVVDRSGSYRDSEYLQGFRFITQRSVAFPNQADVPAGHDDVQETDGEVVGNSDEVLQDAATFGRLAPLVGLAMVDYNRVVMLRQRRYQIVAISPNRSKFPVLVKRLPDGKRFKVTVDQVKVMA